MTDDEKAAEWDRLNGACASENEEYGSRHVIDAFLAGIAQERAKWMSGEPDGWAVFTLGGKLVRAGFPDKYYAEEWAADNYGPEGSLDAHPVRIVKLEEK